MRDGKTFAEGLNAIEHTGSIGAFDGDLFMSDVDFVGFSLVEVSRDKFQHNAVGLVIERCCFECDTRDVVDIFTEEPRLTPKGLLIVDFRLLAKFKGLLFVERHLLGLRDDIVVGFGQLLRAGGEQEQ